MRRTFLLAGAVCCAGIATAQSRSSFLDVSAFDDLTVTPQNGGLAYQVNVGNNPTFTYNGSTYTITDVFGFWVMSNDDDLSASNADVDQWRTANNNSGLGGIAGWKTNPNTGLVPNTSYTFEFDSLGVSSVEQYGFHVRLDGTFPGTNGDTGYATVPEPASMIGLGLGVLALLRRYKK